MDETNADQGETQSVEDRVLAKFSDDPPEQEAAPEPSEPEVTEPAEEEAEIEYQGSRYKVPKALEPAFMQQADYTRKTQEIANQRKALEQSQSTLNVAMMEHEFHQSISDEVFNLKNVDKHIEGLESTDYNEMDSDAIVRHLAQIQRAKAYRDQLSKKIESKHNEFKTEFNKRIQKAKADSHDVLSKSVPGYNPENFKEARDYGLKKGFSEQVLDSIEAQPNAAEILYKAMSYDKLQATKATSVKKLDAPVIKPGSSKPMPQEVKEKLNYRKALSSAKTRDERNAIVQKRIEGMF